MRTKSTKSLDTLPKESATLALRHHLEVLEEHAFDLVVYLSKEGIIKEASKKTLALFRPSKARVIGETLTRLVEFNGLDKAQEAFDKAYVTRVSQTFRAKLGTAAYRWFEFQCHALPGDNSGCAVLITGRDITKSKTSESALLYKALHDPLTGLPNRNLMEDRIKRELAAHKRMGSSFTVVALDLDDFKKANDGLGRSAGDNILKQSSKRLTTLLRGTDTVARPGGDEFLLILPGVSEGRELDLIMSRILASIQKPFEVQGNSVYLTTSLGAAVYPQHGKSLEILLAHADQAMYRAKEQGKNQWHLFQDEISLLPQNAIAIEAAIYDGVRNGEFLMYYQPICDARTGKMAGVEALMRWERPGHGLVLPGEFIPIVEANGLINLLGAWALKSTAMQLAQWDSLGGSPIYASVNVSPRQFRHGQFLEHAKQALDMSQLNPNRLVLEITEGILMQDPMSACVILNELVSMGFRISMDDFGTGYSSLAYLQKFPLHTLKLDRSFIKNLPSNKNDIAIVNAVLAMAKEMNLKVVAEGVEEQEQLDYLADKGCDFIQGWLMGRPGPASTIQSRLTFD